LNVEADVCVVGAGIAGLLAATELQKKNVHAIVVDKGRGVGGRMSVRRTSAGTWDHGAQFFTVCDADFAAQVEEWVTRGVVRKWSTRFPTRGGADVDRGGRYFRGMTGMNAPAKELAAHLTVRMGERVQAIAAEDDLWQIETDAQTVIHARGLIMTPPVPQTLELLGVSGIGLPEEERKTLEGITYDRCIALLLALDGESVVPDPGGLFCDGEPIAWLADNQAKGISATPAITLHAGPSFSREHWDSDDRVIEDRLLHAAKPWLESRVIESHIHRWRYSKPVEVYPQRCFRLSTPLPLLLAGDAFGGPRVEGAALSGLAAAQAMLEIKP